VIDLEYDDVDAAFAQSVGRLCTARLDQTAGVVPGWSEAWWREVAELGVLALGTPGGGTVTTIAATMEQLGQANAPGPFVETFVAVQLLDAERVDAIVAGAHVATVTTVNSQDTFGNLVPWLPIAETVIEIDGSRAYLARVAGEVVTVDSLAGEPWGRAAIERVDDLGDASAALAIGDVAAAAYMVGEAEHLVRGAAAYAADRIQFRTPIGNFQAVAHPLAECFLRVTAARTLARIAAYTIDTGASSPLGAAATARRSATRAALDAAFQVHQAYGAMGFTVEGPVGNRSAKIRQTSLAGRGLGEGTDHILQGRGL
jgi:alkylation response protein AidB-like acyl-CoA dehydrogenase